MPRVRRQRRRTLRSAQFRRRQRYATYTEAFTFSVTMGTSSSLTTELLVGLPPNRPWRVQSISVTATTAYAPPTTSAGADSIVPSAIQLIACEATNFVAASRTVMLGTNPRTVTVRTPSSYDFTQHSSNESWQFGIVEAICVGPVGQSRLAYIRGICYVTVQYSKEILNAGCPSYRVLPVVEQDSSSSGTSRSLSSDESFH